MTDPASRDHFDRMIGALHGLPDTTSTKPATIRALTPLIGKSETFIVQTYRQREPRPDGEGGKSRDTIFIEYIGEGGTIRMVVPAPVADVIARQRDALTTKTRSRISKEQAEDRKARGIAPGFMKHKSQKR